MNKPTTIALALGCLLSFSACSSSGGGGGGDTPSDGSTSGDTSSVTDSGTTSGDTSTTPKDSGTTPTDTGSTSKDTGTTSETGGADDTCGAAASNSECQKCCGTNHADAYNAFVTTLLTCGCKAGNCDVECKDTACASPPKSPTGACTTCLNNVQKDKCKADSTTACTGSGPCAPFTDCVSTQNCNSKP